MTINRIGAPPAGTIGAHAAPAPASAPAHPPAGGATARPARAAVTGPLARLAPPAVRTGNTGGAGAAPRQLRPPPRGPAPASAGNDMAAMHASAMATMAAQNALAQIQNQIAVNQSKNAVIEELGKGLKSLSQ